MTVKEIPSLITKHFHSEHCIVLSQGYPYTRDRIVREARIDIPPFLRGKIWAALLGIQVRMRSKICFATRKRVADERA